MKKLLALFAAASLAAPTLVSAGAVQDQSIKRNTTYICTVSQLERDLAICGLVPIDDPQDDLCVRLDDDDEIRIAEATYRDEDDEWACPVPAVFVAAGATNILPVVAGLGGLGAAGGAAAAAAAAAVLGAAAAGGSSNGTN